MADLVILIYKWCLPKLNTLFLPPTPEMCNLTGKVVKLKESPSACGRLSDIYEGRWFLDSGETALVAMKMIRPVGYDASSLQQLRRRLIGEGAIWCKLQHPNVAPFLGVCYDGDRPGSPCLISHFYRRGSVKKYLVESPSADRLQLSAQILAGLCYLHTQGVIHSDIKGENVVVNERGEALLIDFGLSRALEPTGQTTSLNIGGTVRWMAPELFVMELVDESEDDIMPPPRVTFATDVWSSSMTVFEIFTGCIPFCYIPNDPAVILAIQRGGRPRACPEIISCDIWAAMQRCWETSPQERPSAYAFSVLLNIASGLRRGNTRPLSVPEVVKILEFVDERASGGRGSSNRWMQLKQFPAPYECYWPWCYLPFHGLLECQEHMVHHALSM